MAEEDSAGAFGLKLAYGQRIILGKLRPNTPRCFAPPPADGFHDHGDEGDPLVTAVLLGVLVVFLKIFITSLSGGNGFRTQEGVAQHVHAKSAGDGKIPRGWGPASHLGMYTSAGRRALGLASWASI